MLTRFKNRVPKRLLFVVTMFVLLIGIIITSAVVYASSYHTIRISYVFANGKPAHDPYVATFVAGDEVDLTVKHPNIDGYIPMTSASGGLQETSHSFNYDSINEDVNIAIYYLAGQTHYRVMYYKQNIYDDLYTRDNTVSSQYTDRYGETGSNPTQLSTEALFEGFTNLFHEPDAIAADGSTVFRVYYDRNYYTVDFDLGSGGYGVEPVYAKYQTVYHIGDPKRPGYSFDGWVQTTDDSSKGTYGEDWYYMDASGNVLKDSEGNPTVDIHGKALTEGGTDVTPVKFNDGTVSSKNSYYKAMWTAATTQYSIVYWIEKPESTLDDDDLSGKTEAEAEALLTDNYSVASAYDIKNATSGDELTYNNTVATHDLFDFDDLAKAFPTMSTTLRTELEDYERYFELNSTASRIQFNQNSTITVAGDGSTRINMYYNRADINLKFFYAKTTGGTVTTDENGSKGLTGGTVYLTNGTKNFGVNGQDAANAKADPVLTQVSRTGWTRNVVSSLPTIVKEGLKADYIDDTSSNNSTRYWFYELSANFGASMQNVWFNDAFAPQQRKDSSDTKEVVRFGSWAVQEGSRYKINKTNFTVKGFFEKLQDKVLLTDTFIDYNNANTAGFDFKQLYFAASWMNTGTINGSQWNDGAKRVYNFTYKNYTQLLPCEDYIIEKVGWDVFINGGDYPAGTYSKNGFNFDAGHWDGTKYVEVIENNGVRYGLKSDNIIQTYDAGDQYGTATSLKSEPTLTNNVRSNQTAVTLTGYSYVSNNSRNPIVNNYTRKYKDGGNVGTENVTLSCSNGNTLSVWYDADGEGGFDQYHHADVLHFYNFETYALVYRNNNVKQTAQSPRAPYDGPFNAAPLRIDNPVYPEEGLENYYEFKGWYWDPFHIKQVDYSTDHMPASDTTFYAKWEPKKIKVSFYQTYNEYYESYSDKNHPEKFRIPCIYDKENNKWTDGDINVEYGKYTPLENVPVNKADQDERPVLTPPAEGAMFAGWYYLRDNVPVRFEPENVPVTALNAEAAKQGGELKLFAEWVTKDVAKYKVSYVEKDHPDVEVASPTTGRAFVWKTRTFDAKGGSQLNEDHKWVDSGVNWWPTTNSHSLVIKANEDGEEFEPNTHTFEYVKKTGVWYKIQYLDAITRTPIEGLDSVERYSTDASIKADAPYKAGYMAQQASQSLVLLASTKSAEAEQKAEELEQNVITFLYDENTTDYVYEVEYYNQNLDDDGYSLFQTENLTVPKSDPTVSVADLYDRHFPMLFAENGYTRKAGATKVYERNGTENIYSVADNGTVTISSEHRTTIRIYFDRNTYPYSYQYIDYKAERDYNQAVKDGEDVTGMWNGVIASYNGAQNERVEKEVSIPALTNINDTHTGTSVPYTRVEDKVVTAVIAPNENNAGINNIKVYYRKAVERELNYKLVCVNEGEQNVEVDYDKTTGDPLFGGLSMTLQTVETQSQINNVKFHDYNDFKNGNTGTSEDYVHQHKYTFLGWYSSKNYDENNPSANRLTTSDTLKTSDLGLDEDELPADQTTYYALVKQDMVKAQFEIRLVEDDLPIGTGAQGVEPEDLEAAEIVKDAPIDDGSKSGSYFKFNNPSTYTNNALTPWHRSDGFSVRVDPIDNRVYKYEFAEWWEEDLTKYEEDGVTHPFVRKKTWNDGGGWTPTVLSNQLPRNQDYHIIAVFKRSEVSSIPSTVKFRFNTRSNGTQDYVCKQTLSGTDLDESSLNTKINDAGAYELTDEYIMTLAPYESNHGETLCWTDRNITKTSVKGDPDAENEADRVDHMITTVVADQKVKKAYANYKLLPSDDDFTTIETTIGANRITDEKLGAINASNLSYDGKEFSYWEIRKTDDPDGDVIAKCYDAWFTFCMMDNYYITPVYDGETSAESDPDYSQIKLSHLDNSRNRWTDENGDIAPSGISDLLYCDFEIAFNNKDKEIYSDTSEKYETGVVFELCTKLPSGKKFVEGKDYGYASDENNLKQAILDKSSVYYYTSGKRRQIQTSVIPSEDLTNKNRVEYFRSYTNAYKETNGEKTYTNKTYVMKVYAYLIDKTDNSTPVVTLSNYVYVCLYDIGSMDMAVNDMIVNTPDN